MAGDLKDDVDRLFACFKCGITTPESALKERRLKPENSKRLSLARGEKSVAAAAEVAAPSSSGRIEQSDNGKEKLGGSTSILLKLKSGRHISPVVFYGSPHGAPIKRPTKLFRLLREIQADLREQLNLPIRKEVWATFPRQEEAMRFLKAHAQTILFSYQDHLNGQRRFLVSTYDEFWRRYETMNPNFRHHYEVIQEGLPCHLYFDLEFDKRLNIDRDVDEMVDILTSIVFSVLFDKYAIHGDREWLIELDSSTVEKFSRHVILRIPKVAFKDNSHVGGFVSEVCSRINNERGKSSQLDKLYIKKDSSAPYPDQLFLDNAVYTRNRCFRLAFSSKAGKSSFLVPSGRFRCKNMGEKQVFMESLICRMDMDCQKFLICKEDIECKKNLLFDFEVQQQAHHPPRCTTMSTYRSDFPNTYLSGKSPFPALDAFVESIASTGDISGKIQSWYWLSAHGLMVYSMSRNRYCERIGREHKSNHVIYVADLQTAGYYQKCHDPDCRGYRSPLRPLPDDVLPDDYVISSLSETGNSMKIKDISFNLAPDVNVLGSSLHGNCELITDSCKKDYNWWQEAMTYADCVENKKNVSASNEENDDMAEDCEWWMVAERLASQVEEHIG